MLQWGAELSGEVAEWCGVVWLGCGLVRSCLVRLRSSAELSSEFAEWCGVVK